MVLGGFRSFHVLVLTLQKKGLIGEVAKALCSTSFITMLANP